MKLSTLTALTVAVRHRDNQSADTTGAATARLRLRATIRITACKLPRRPSADEPPEAGPATPLAILSFELGVQQHTDVELNQAPSGRLFFPRLGWMSPALEAAVRQALHLAATAPDTNFRQETDREVEERRETWARHRGYETLARLRAGRGTGAD